MWGNELCSETDLRTPWAAKRTGCGASLQSWVSVWMRRLGATCELGEPYPGELPGLSVPKQSLGLAQVSAGRARLRQGPCEGS